MSDTDTTAARVQRWRKTKREKGLKACTIWLTTDEELLLKDLAVKRHCSPSEIMRQALAQFQSFSPQSISNVTDIELIREIIRAELTVMKVPLVPATDNVTEIPTEISAISTTQETVREDVTATSNGYVTDISTPIQTAEAPEPRRATKRGKRTVSPTHTDVSPPAPALVGDTDIPEFDAGKYILGKLCPRGHEHGTTGQSLLRISNRHCGACDREKWNEKGSSRRQARRQTPPARRTNRTGPRA